MKARIAEEHSYNNIDKINNGTASGSSIETPKIYQRSELEPRIVSLPQQSGTTDQIEVPLDLDAPID